MSKPLQDLTLEELKAKKHEQDLLIQRTFGHVKHDAIRCLHKIEKEIFRREKNHGK